MRLEPSEPRTTIHLVVLGALMSLVSFFSVRIGNDDFNIIFGAICLTQFVIYPLGCLIVLRRQAQRRTHLIVIVFFALLARLPLVLVKPHLSDDIYRYVWDGRVQAAGINPYRYLPSADELKSLRDERIYPHINRRDTAPTIYPPVAQAIFFGVSKLSPDSITALKAALMVFDLATIILLILILRRMQLPVGRVLIYAWNPLVVWEFAHSGHIDAAAITFVVLAILLWLANRPAMVGISLGLATLVKLSPAILAPVFYRRWDWKLPLAFVATFVVGYLPYLDVGAKVIGYLPGYLNEEGFANGQRFFPLMIVRLLRAMPTEAYLAVALTILFILALHFGLKKDKSPQFVFTAGLTLLGATLLVATPSYPWYYIILIPLLCVATSTPWFGLVMVVPLLNLLLVTHKYPPLELPTKLIVFGLGYALVIKMLLTPKLASLPNRSGFR